MKRRNAAPDSSPFDIVPASFDDFGLRRFGNYALDMLSRIGPP